MQVEFAGEPFEIAARSGVAVAARANGRPLTCVVSREALNEASRSLRRGVTGRAGVFRQSARRFRDALAAKLSDDPRAPAAVITLEDLRRVER